MSDIFNRFEHFGKLRKAAIYILLILCVAHVCFIFSNSMKDAETSTAQSDDYVRFFIEKLLHLDYDGQSEEFVSAVTVFIRKTAHFCEYALLGTLAFMLFFCCRCRLIRCLELSVFLCFLVGTFDEFLQRFSFGRSASFLDTLLDTSGGLTAGIVLFFIVKYVVLNRSDHHKLPKERK